MFVYLQAVVLLVVSRLQRSPSWTSGAHKLDW